jgi:O-antigen/teichoic acid export membrane protein
MSVWKLDGTVLKDIFWKSKTFFAIESIAVLNDRMQTLILSFFGSEALVGLYGAVIQLIQPFYIVSHSLSMAVFPGLTKAVEMGREQQKRMAEGITTALLCISLPLFVGSLFVGKDVLSFLYGDASFTAASGALSVSVLAVVLTSFARPLTYVLVANGLERINLYQVVVTSFTGAIVGVVLVSNYQLMGAAIAAVLMSILNVTIYIYAVFSRLFKIDFWSTLQAPLAIGTSMIPVFSILGATVRSVPIGLILASAAYCAIAAAVGIWSVGGPKGLRSQLFQRS